MYITRNKTAGLWHYELSDEEYNRTAAVWQAEGTISSHISETRGQLTWLRQIFKDAMLFFLHATPNLTTVIPAMDHIDKTLTMQSHDSGFEPSIQAAVSIAKKTLNKYYDKTDHSEVYCIAMSMFFLHFISNLYL